MGALCCCFNVHDEQNNNNPSNNASSNNCWLPKWFFQKFTTKHNQQARASSNSGIALINNPSDADASHNNVGPTQEIGTSRSRVQPEPSEQSDDHIRVDKDSRNLYPSIDDEEESCSTCFEEYDEENPKTILKCSHHYHLSCIYEWMERSVTCPTFDAVPGFELSLWTTLREA
ncbi:hypothetical protein CASFOL_009780 [Castilleja foliolosa]|uniref:RING-type E3 ubiquitin transferase n=1 Tax=Castilleja foliolosa TaxID=1961234 RepID=A0ABD3DQU5_9LAMI